MKKSFQAVEITLGKGIKFVIVTACAIERLAKPDRGGRFHPIGRVFGEEFLGDDPTFLIEHMIAVQARRDALLQRGLW